MGKKVLHCMVGLPRSGKSTKARKMGFPIVNPDSIRLSLHGQRFVQEAEPYVWAIARTMVNALFLAGHADVILDATNTTEDGRKKWISKEWDTKFVLIKTSANVCLERARAELDEIIQPVIIRMNESLSWPEARIDCKVCGGKLEFGNWAAAYCANCDG